MKHFRLKLFAIAFPALILAGFPFFIGHADARGRFGGGAVRGFGAGGFSGGSFARGGGYATGPRGGAAVVGPRGGAAAVGPRGGAAAVGPRGGAAVRGPAGYGAARGPTGGTAVRGPGGNTYNVNRNVTVNQGWGAWGGYRPVAVAAGVAAGAFVASLPYAYQTTVVSGQTYYVANGTYYQQCYQGAEVGYCAVTQPGY